MWISKKEIRELSEGIQKTLEGQEFDPRDDKEGPWSILKNDIYTLINLEREQRDCSRRKGKIIRISGRYISSVEDADFFYPAYGRTYDRRTGK